MMTCEKREGAELRWCNHSVESHSYSKQTGKKKKKQPDSPLLFLSVPLLA